MGNTKIFQITDREYWLDKRKSYITSTESASLFGLQMSARPTAYELWHLKRGIIEEADGDSNYLSWGREMEPAIMRLIQAENPEWDIKPMHGFAYDDEDKIGSSFDYVATIPREIVQKFLPNLEIDGEFATGLIEIKMTNYKNWMEKFIIDDEIDEETGRPVFIEAPSYYEVQCQHELEALNKYDFIILAVAVVDYRTLNYIWRERDREFGKAIREKIKEFWYMQEPPSPDLNADSDLLARMHRANSNDSVKDLTEDKEADILLSAYLQESKKETSAKDAKKRMRSQIIIKMGDCNTAWSQGHKVSNKSSFRITETRSK
jgi:predicted phage-related endonuclease